MKFVNTVLLLFITAVQFLNGAEIKIAYTPGLSPVRPFLISINDGKLTVTAGKDTLELIGNKDYKNGALGVPL